MRGSAHVHPRVFGRKLEVKLNGAISDVQFKPSVIVRIGNRGVFHVLVNAEMIEAAACDMVLCSNPNLYRELQTLKSTFFILDVVKFI